MDTMHPEKQLRQGVVVTTIENRSKMGSPIGITASVSYLNNQAPAVVRSTFPDGEVLEQISCLVSFLGTTTRLQPCKVWRQFLL
jgi:hypothetical protein